MAATFFVLGFFSVVGSAFCPLVLPERLCAVLVDGFPWLLLLWGGWGVYGLTARHTLQTCPAG